MRRTRFLALGLTAVAAAAPVVAEAGVRCAATRRGDRVLLAVRLERLFDKELLRLVRLGLAGKLEIEATLYRRRAYWFDDARARRTIAATVTFARPASWLLDGTRPIDPTVFDLPIASLGVGRVDAGDHYVELTARLQVVTAASLGQAARFLSDGGGAAAPLPTGGLVRAIVSDLVRTSEASCAVTAPPR